MLLVSPGKESRKSRNSTRLLNPKVLTDKWGMEVAHLFSVYLSHVAL